LIGWILAPGEEPPAIVPRPRAVVPEAGSPRASRDAPRDASRDARLPGPRGPAVTPRAARLAIELGVDWARVHGTGRNGRIRARDVIAAAQAAASPSVATQLSPLRSAIARRLSLGAERVVPVTLTREVDVTAITRWRTLRKEAGEPAPSITALFARLAAGALREHPALNSVWSGGEISSSERVHVSIAIDTEKGLVAPVLRDACGLSLTEASERIRSLTERARSGALKADELEGGTFTITNLGAAGVDAFTPIVHHPQVAILGLGRIERRPAVIGERLEARDRMWLSLTFDHRALDGAPAARFLEALCWRLARPEDSLKEAQGA
jgi:pyruvate dehydrogenase E2 component (dihydrolipoamide acetyltransferase)